MAAGSSEFEWRKRLHTPDTPAQVTPALRASLANAEAILWPSLSDPAAHAASLLVIAPPDGGKSLFARLLTGSLEARLNAAGKPSLVVVRLDAITTSPAQVWRELSTALHASPALQRDGGGDGNGTARPDEEGREAGADDEDSPSLIRPALDRLRDSGIPLLLVLDHFHRLATPDPLAQTVLYTLFNLLQDRALSAACVALTAVVDVQDLLEKRVKSRFAARPLVLPQPRDVAEVIALVRTAFHLDDAEAAVGAVDVAGGSTGGGAGKRGAGRTRARGERRNTRTKRVSGASSRARTEGAPPLQRYQTLGEQIVSSEAFSKAVTQHMARSRAVAGVLRAVDAGLTAGLLCAESGAELGEGLAAVCSSLEVSDPFLAAVGWLTERQQKVLVALCRVATDPGRRGAAAPGAPGGMRRVGFEEVFAEVGRFGRRGDGHLEEGGAESRVGRDVAAREWEALVEYGLVIRARGGVRDGPAAYCAVSERAVFEAVQRSGTASTTLQRWARAKAVRG